MADIKQQQFAFNDEEIKLIKDMFCDNDALINGVRNHFLQFEMTTEQKAALMMLTSDHKAFLRKLFIPLANSSQGIQRISDAWGSIDMNEGPEKVYPIALSREWQLKYMYQQFDLLDGKGEEKMNLDALVSIPLPRNEQDVYVNLYSRRSIFILVDSQLALVLKFAGAKVESVEDAKARLLKDSAK